MIPNNREPGMPVALPAPFAERMERQLGSHAGDFFAALTGEPPVAVRINPAKWRGEISLEKVPWSSTGYYLPGRPQFTLDPWLHAGTYYVQEPSSMFLEQAVKTVNREGPLLVLDLCGAPGGKSTHLLSLLAPEDLLVSNEVIRSRAAILEENIQKWGSPNVIVTNSDPRDFSRLPAIFDLVVVDAPCSGEGLFRKDPSAIREWSPENASLCAARQKRIVADVWQCLKPGGFLIYSTCTFNPGENEENLAWLKQQKGAEPVEITLQPEWKIQPVQNSGMTGYRFLPHLTKGEGFFTGVIQKPAGATTFRFQKGEPKIFQPALKQVSAALLPWLSSREELRFFSNNNGHFAFPARWAAILPVVEKTLKVIQAGLPAATGNLPKPVPHAALALSPALRPAVFPEYEMTLEEAVSFLRKETPAAPPPTPGWNLATYQKIPAGWLKNVGNRANNYFPKEWRIRMVPGEIPPPWHHSRENFSN